jgi:FkbM family methyltransferase
LSETGKLQWALRRLGLELRRANAWTVSELRVVEYLKHLGVQTVLDVGANDGGYASELIRAGWTGAIVSYEPLPTAWEGLRAQAAAHPGWSVAPRQALSDSTGEVTFFEAGNSYSSSLLRMTDTHVSAAPESATVREIQVPTVRLDDVIGDAGPGPHFLKIDVQGGEMMVLGGAPESLRGSVVAVQTEVSLAELYEGQPHAGDVDVFLKAAGFELWDVIPGFRDPATMRLLQYDAIYVRG